MIWIVLLTAFICGSSSPATAQSDQPRLELWGGISGGTLASKSTIVSNYSPPLLLDGDFTSRAGQTITAGTNWAAGFTAGVDLFPWRHAGVQVLVDRVRYEVAATSSSYDLTLEYTSVPPPANQPQPVTIDNARPWPDLTGSLTQLVLAVNAVARLGDPRRVAVAVAAGPTLMRISGTIEPLGYTTFHLGGHSVLFEDDYRVGASLATTASLGVNAGAELSVAAAPHVALIVAARYMGGGANVPLRIERVLNPADVTFTQSIHEVAAGMGSPSLHAELSGPRVFVGLKVMR